MTAIRPHNENSIILQQSVTSCRVSTKLHRRSWATPYLARLQPCSVPHNILHQDGAPPEWGLDDRAYEDEQTDRHRRPTPPALLVPPDTNATALLNVGLCQEQFTNHRLPEMMTLRNVSRMQTWLFTLTYSSEHANSHLEYFRTWQKLEYLPDVVLPRVPTLADVGYGKNVKSLTVSKMHVSRWI